MSKNIEQLDVVGSCEEVACEGGVKYVRVELVENDEGIGFSIPVEEPYAGEFMRLMGEIDRQVAMRTLTALIRSCEINGRNILAREIRTFLESPDKAIH
jgi:hypothetical protein